MPEHLPLAEETVTREGFGDRIRILHGRGAEVLLGLEGPYDLIFSDGDP
jgi:predicted O-methyltransferase YrrM